jgi:hypothetical protein
MPRLKTLYHASPENVNVLRPRYSPKFGMKGLFVSSKPSAMQNSWVGWASSKDRAPGRRDLPYHKRPQGSFKTITLYTLSLPMEDYQQAVERHWKRFDELQAAGVKNLHGAFFWDEETFIPEDLMKNLKIIGKRTDHKKEIQGPQFNHPTIGMKPSSPRMFDANVILKLEPEKLASSIKLLSKEEIQKMIESLQKVDFEKMLRLAHPDLHRVVSHRNPEMQRILNNLRNKDIEEQRQKLKNKRDEMLKILQKKLEESVGKNMLLKSLIFEELEDGDPELTVYHGTTRSSAENMLKNGWQPYSGFRGSQQGNPKYLYVTNYAESAQWYAEEKGSDAVIAIKVRLSDLISDPEDGVEPTAAKELETAAKFNLPANLAIKHSIPASSISLVGNGLNEQLDLSEGDIEEIANYPEGFSLEKLKSLPSYAQKTGYAMKHLARIGAGSSRVVFVADDQTAIKVAKNKKGLAQNELEIEVSQYDSDGVITAKVFDHDEDNLWVEMELARKAKPSDFPNLIGFPMEVFFDSLKVISNRLHGWGSNSTIDPSLSENESFKTIVQIMADLDMTHGDITRISSWGVVKRNGKEKLVLVDFGLNKQVWNNYYLRR